MQRIGMIDIRTHVLNLEILRDACQEFFRCKTVQIADHAIVIDNLEMGGRECDSHEIVIFLVAAMIGIVLCLLIAYEGSGCGAMMTVGYV